jgi:outer membrane protein assembly factor BamB
VFIGSCSGVFYALDKETGGVRWSYDTAEDGDPAQFHGDPLVTEDLVVTGSDRSTRTYTYAFRRQTGKLVWKQDKAAFETDLLRVGSAVVGRRWNGDLLAVALDDGEVQWKITPLEYVYSFREDDSPIVKDNVVYFGGVDGYLYAIDGLEGQTIWKRDLGNRITTTPVTDGRYVYAGVADNTLYRLATRDGSVVSTARCSGRPRGRPALAGNTLIVILDDSTLAAFDGDLETVVWTRAGEPRWSSHQPPVWRGSVVAGTSRGEVSGFSVLDGSRTFSVTVGGVIRGLGVSQDVLYVGNFGGTLRAYRLLDE